jgi:hypothetical protein
MQHDVGRYLIGGVLLAPEHRYPQQIEQRMAEFMQAGVEQGPHDSVDRRDAGRRRFRGHGLPELVDIFVTNRYDAVFIEGIGIAVTSLHLHQQCAGESEWCEELLQFFEETELLELLVIG